MVTCDRLARGKNSVFVPAEAQGLPLEKATPYAVSSALRLFDSGNSSAPDDVVGIAVFCGYKGISDKYKDVVRVLFAKGVASDPNEFSPLFYRHCVREMCERSVAEALLESFDKKASMTHPFGPFNKETKARIAESLKSDASHFVRYKIPGDSPNYHFEPVRLPSVSTSGEPKPGDIVVNLGTGEVLYRKGRAFAPAL
ncbi:MAG: hypothetical protein PHW76_02885 [Alphaproteobacteria bacterium]|nr:hypothetical protein [Alphaproteobacteria bacterium]